MMNFDVQKTDDTKSNFTDPDALQSQSSVDSDKDEKMSNASTSTVLYSMDNESKADEYIKETLENSCDLNSSPTDGGNLSASKEKNAEDEKLDQLLRLASSNPTPAKRSYPEEKANLEKEDSNPKVQEKEESQKRARTKTPELTLIDCLNSQELGEEIGERILPDSKKDEDFLKQFNNEVKNLFLFSSESDDGTESEKEKHNKDKKIREKKLEKNNESARKVQKKRKDDLRKYQISSSEDEEEEIKEESKMPQEKEKEKEQTTEKAKKTLDDEDCDVISDSGNSVEVLMNPSDSDSEVVQINEIPASSFPVKGRKNIKKILDVKNLQLETKQALKMETERKRRLKERQELIKKLCEKQDQGSKLILDFDPKTMKELVVVDENLSKHLKAHQREGVQFMWNCCFENLTRLKDEKGSGCVLAHCMGLGKTLQVITLIHSVLNHSADMRTALIVCPLVTIANWFHEFKIWMKDCNNPIIPFDLGPAHKKNFDQIELWMQKGGVLILSYEMFRSLTKKVCFSFCKKYLLDPGPDIVVCDEGHLMKNRNSELSKCMSRIRTLRRIVLTGTPLQNNLVEYYCMVQFVKPNLLGTEREFLNRFVNPITNGQFENSTQRDVHIMKQRSHVLHTLLESFVQRLGYSVLEPLLPEKQEFAISIALTETQEKTYNLCVQERLKESRGLLWDFHWFYKVWTHPYTIRHYHQQNNLEEAGSWMKFFTKEDYESIQSSNKLVLLFCILKKCHQIGDKVLVFSHSLYTLSLIENFLCKLNSDYEEGRQSEFAGSWVLGRDYFKLTGAVKYGIRESYFKSFSTSQRARLFLISTKTGGVGINLVAANRVILFDASWNPAQDLQSIFRVYRFGQKKPCYIYRFLAAATMEEKIYKRQVTKLSLAHRILDEHQIERHYSSDNLQELYTYNPIPKSEWKIPKIPKDEIFAEILSNNRDIIVSYHEHNSLLENKEEEELTEEERRAAWENYEKEKTSPQKPPFDRNFVSAHQRSTVNIGNPFGPIYNNIEVTEICGNENENQQFTGFDSRQKSNGFQGTGNLLEVGNLLGLKPIPGEKAEEFRRRLQTTLKNIYPWGTPKVIIQGDVINNK